MSILLRAVVVALRTILTHLANRCDGEARTELTGDLERLEEAWCEYAQVSQGRLDRISRRLGGS